MQSWLYKQGKARGFAEGFVGSFAKSYARAFPEADVEEVARHTRETLLEELQDKGISIPSDARAGLLACKDVAQIEKWVDVTMRPGIIEVDTSEPQRQPPNKPPEDTANDAPEPEPHATAIPPVLGDVLGWPFRTGEGRPGGWVILEKPELRLGPAPDKLTPALAGWRAEEAPIPLDDDGPPSYDVTPDWVCEILSPGTETRDRIRKMRIYLREGVQYVWIVHPIARALEVFRNEGGGWLAIDQFEQLDYVHAEPFSSVAASFDVLRDGPRGP